MSAELAEPAFMPVSKLPSPVKCAADTVPVAITPCAYKLASVCIFESSSYNAGVLGRCYVAEYHFFRKQRLGVIGYNKMGLINM